MGALALLCCAFAASPAAHEPYTWPLDLPREVTSSFGEYRPGRFHAGIDLRTGSIGQPVHAAGDGYVSRIRCSPFGYGKAIYITLEDGMTVVYGHLSDYRDDLRAYINAAQHKARDYTVDLSPAPGQFKVARGEIIAKSGDTGIGVPHLHWEFRDKAGHLVNPRLLGITWPDDTRPLIQQLLVWPEDGTVNGDPAPQVLPVKSLGGGSYAAAPLEVSGRVFFGVDTFDPEKGGAKLGIHEATVRLGDKEVFTMRNDTLDYDTTACGAVAFSPCLSSKSPLLALWRYPGNGSPNYQLTAEQGDVIAPRQDSRATITITDFAGNAATLDVPLTPQEPRATPPAGKPGNGHGAFDAIAWGDYLALSARFDQAEGELPAGTWEGGGKSGALCFVPVGTRTARAIFKPAGSGIYKLRAQHPRSQAYDQDITVYAEGAATSAAEADGLSLAPAPDTPYGTLFVTIATESAPPRDAIRRFGPAWRVGPDMQPLRQEIAVSVPKPADAENPKHLALYRANGSSWTYLDTESYDGHLSAKSARLGIFAVLEDDVPPVIGKIETPNPSDKASRRPTLRAELHDIGSGLNKCEIYCGANWLIGAFDPEKSLLYWDQDEDLPRGKQTITFRVTDRVGNETKVCCDIIVP